MAFKIISIVSFISLAIGSPVEEIKYNPATTSKSEGLTFGYESQKPLSVPIYRTVEYEQSAPVAYDFNYAVHDEHTGDIKSQKEVRNGDAVQGRYELIDSDGYRRIVEYTADGHNGFNAVVHREPVDIKIPQPIPQDPNLAHAAPIIKDIPVQAHPVNKAVVYSVPKYSAPTSIPQYFVNPAYTGSVRSPAVYGAAPQRVQSNSRIPASTFYRPTQFIQPSRTPAQLGLQYSSNNYPTSAYYNEGYSPQVYKTPEYSNTRYNTIAYSAPSFNTNSYYPQQTIQAYDTGANNQDYYGLPETKNYYTGPAVTRLSYSAPASALLAYRKEINSGPNSDYNQNYFGLTQGNSVWLQSGFRPIPFAQVKSAAPSGVHPTQATIIASAGLKSEGTLSDYSSIGASKQEGDASQKVSTPTYSSGDEVSADTYSGTSNTVSHQH